MPVTRRAVLVALTLGVSGCAASPVINGSPAVAPSPPPPTQHPVDAAAQLAVATLAATLRAVGDVEGWATAGWTAAASAQCDAQLTVLSLPDPFVADPQTPFTVATPRPATPASLAEATSAVDAQLAATVSALEAAAAAAAEGDSRLLYASAATSTSALTDRALVPATSDAAPARLQATTLEASVPIALSHAWALVYGLGVGIGRLGSKDPLRALGTARLAIVKGLRNDLRAVLTGEPPEQPAAFELPNPMTTPDEIRAAWAQLETNLLDGYARLVAASDDPRWRTAMLAQIAPVQALGGRLGPWPGWIA